MDEFEYCESNSDGISFFSDFPLDAHADSTDGDLDVHFHEMFTNNDSILKPAPKRVRPRLDGVFTPSEDEDSPTTLQQPLIFNTRENWNSLPSSSNALYMSSHVDECNSESFSPALVTSFFESRCPSECSPEPMPSPNSLSITPPVSPLPLRANVHAMDLSFACSCDSKFPGWENLLSIQVRTSAKDLLSALFLDNGLLRKIHHLWGASEPFFGDWTAADKNASVRQLNYVYPLFDDAVSLPCIEDQLLIIREDNHSQVVSKITCPRIIAACVETSFCITQSPLDSLESILRVHAPSGTGNEMQIFQSERVHFLEILKQELEGVSRRIDDNTYETENKFRPELLSATGHNYTLSQETSPSYHQTRHSSGSSTYLNSEKSDTLQNSATGSPIDSISQSSSRLSHCSQASHLHEAKLYQSDSQPKPIIRSKPLPTPPSAAVPNLKSLGAPAPSLLKVPELFPSDPIDRLSWHNRIGIAVETPVPPRRTKFLGRCRVAPSITSLDLESTSSYKTSDFPASSTSSVLGERKELFKGQVRTVSQRRYGIPETRLRSVTLLCVDHGPGLVSAGSDKSDSPLTPLIPIAPPPPPPPPLLSHKAAQIFAGQVRTSSKPSRITEVCLKPVSRVTEPKILENSVVGPKQKLSVLLAEIEGFEPKEKGEADCASRMTMTSQLGSRSLLSPKKLQAEKTGFKVSTKLQEANFPSMASSPNGNVSTKTRRPRKDLPKRVEIRLKMPGHWVRGNSPKPIEEYLAELPVRQQWLNDLKYNSFAGNSVLALAFQLVVVSIAVSGATPFQLMGVMYKLWFAGGVICQFVARVGSAWIANTAKKSGEFFAMRMGFVRKASEQVLASDVDLTATASKILHAAPAAVPNKVMPNIPKKEIGQVAGMLTGKMDAESTHAMTLLELFSVIFKIIF
ncbi:hypothetical protein BJ741DRAFT_646524 [Chytriomyces cf. hyalinus JEL632]|nr:hypothetical protein BJ741DRAFT_646524 [Chytriomyces cf. hyalinus JEL632]